MLIAEVQKNMKERIRVSIEEYKGHKFIDCRVYFEDAQGEWRPTKKGIALNDDSIDEVIEALKKARTQLINPINQVNRTGRKIDDTKLTEMLNQGKLQKQIAEYFGVSAAAVCKRIKRLTPQDNQTSVTQEVAG